MIKYIKTPKGYYYKILNNGEKKRISHKEYNKKIKGGTLNELKDVNSDTKLIVLMGEIHTRKTNKPDYDMIIEKQENIIDLAIDKFGDNDTIFYSELPEEDVKMLTNNTDNYAIIIGKALRKLGKNVKLSSVKFCDRKNCDKCDDMYAKDIKQIFEQNMNAKCFIAAIGIGHLPGLSYELSLLLPDTKIITINTCSDNQISNIYHILKTEDPLLFKFIKDNPPYTLNKDKKRGFGQAINNSPTETNKYSKLGMNNCGRENHKSDYPVQQKPSDGTYNPIVKFEKNPDGTTNKIYECPKCHGNSGNLLIVTHNYRRVNKNKDPKEEPSL